MGRWWVRRRQRNPGAQWVPRINTVSQSTLAAGAVATGTVVEVQPMQRNAGAPWVLEVVGPGGGKVVR